MLTLKTCHPSGGHRELPPGQPEWLRGVGRKPSAVGGRGRELLSSTVESRGRVHRKYLGWAWKDE